MAFWDLMNHHGGPGWRVLGDFGRNGTGREELGQERAETEKQDLR
jgi:hypothetical protein